MARGPTASCTNTAATTHREGGSPPGGRAYTRRDAGARSKTVLGLAVCRGVPKRQRSSPGQRSHAAKARAGSPEALTSLLEAAVSELSERQGSASEDGEEVTAAAAPAPLARASPVASPTGAALAASSAAAAQHAARCAAPETSTWLAGEEPAAAARQQQSPHRQHQQPPPPTLPLGKAVLPTVARLLSFPRPEGALAAAAAAAAAHAAAAGAVAGHERYYRKALRSLEASLGPYHPEVGKAFLQLACFYFRRGQTQQAELCVLRSWDVMKHQARLRGSADLRAAHSAFLCVLEDMQAGAQCVASLRAEVLEPPASQQLASPA